MHENDPAAQLRAAAEKLREAATAAQNTDPAPWAAKFTHDDATLDHVFLRNASGHLVMHGLVGRVGRAFMQGPAGRYAALVHPGVGLAVADWLEHEARQETWTLAEFGYRSASAAALAVARAVLGSAS